MSDIGKLEKATQKRVVALFRDELSNRFLGKLDGARGKVQQGMMQEPLAGKTRLV